MGKALPIVDYNRNSVVLYHGPSALTGEPIAMVMTGLGKESGNVKTGHMLQTYIIPTFAEPKTLVKEAKESSVCGDCPARPGKGGWCYVNQKTVMSVWGALQRGSYLSMAEHLDLVEEMVEGSAVRAGTWGDPAAVPSWVWAAIGNVTTGYTHQWRDPRFQDLKHFLMASVDTPEEAEHAQALGWRTFRNSLPDEPELPGEIECPAYTVGLTCAECKLCGGNRIGGKNIYAKAHGALSPRYARWRKEKTHAGNR